MNKIQDGFFAGGDSYKPLILSSDRRSYASLSFVGSEVVLRGIHGATLRLVSQSDGALVFSIEPVEVAEQPNVAVVV